MVTLCLKEGSNKFCYLIPEMSWLSWQLRPFPGLIEATGDVIKLLADVDSIRLWLKFDFGFWLKIGHRKHETSCVLVSTMTLPPPGPTLLVCDMTDGTSEIFLFMPRLRAWEFVSAPPWLALIESKLSACCSFFLFLYCANRFRYASIAANSTDSVPFELSSIFNEWF